ncbi:MAG: S41 family peptidase [Candidatus Staskawiczbacteria bacterium]|jgi:carboxyl-terminal processing protease
MNINYKKIIYSVVFVIILLAAVALGIWIGVNKVAYHVPQPGTIDFSLFWDAYSQLKENFISPEKIDDQKVIYGAIKGMAESLGDPYTDFFNPSQAKLFQQDLSGSFGGIGVEIGIKEDMLTIIAPLKNTPGERAGLKSGDVIVKINGQDSSKMTGDEAVSLIRGPKGKSVILSIMREGWDNTKDITIVRDTIKVPFIEWSLINSLGDVDDKNGDIAYIQIYQFNESLSEEFKVIALKILQSPAKKIILDLRNNPGGYLEVSQDIAGWFLQKDQVVTIEDFGKAKSQEIYKTSGNSGLISYPIVVLINEGSASASEILAGALRDNRNIKLIGMKSFGKGSVQQVISLNGGAFLKITIAHWLTPKGKSISEVGLTPDIEIDITEQDVENKKDSQLDKAIEIVNNLK